MHIAEDDGEVDMDFPALDNKEPLSKFGFGKLALVQKEIPETLSKTEETVTAVMYVQGHFLNCILWSLSYYRKPLDRTPVLGSKTHEYTCYSLSLKDTSLMRTELFNEGVSLLEGIYSIGVQGCL